MIPTKIGRRGMLQRSAVAAVAAAMIPFFPVQAPASEWAARKKKMAIRGLKMA